MKHFDGVMAAGMTGFAVFIYHISPMASAMGAAAAVFFLLVAIREMQ